MAKGKLIVMNGSTVENSTVLVTINLGNIESIVWNALQARLSINMISGKEYLYDKLNNTEISEISEFLTAYINSLDSSEITKTLHITSGSL